MRQAVARRVDLWRGGAISAILQPLLRGRHTGALVTVTTADDRLHVRPGRVRSPLRQYFAGVFDNEGQAQWFETEEHNARILRDDSVGWELREDMVRGGDSPTDHPNMVFLTAMARRKEGVAGMEARLHDRMAAIGIEEWVKYWSSKGGGESPGRSGIGSSLLKAAPREVHLALLRI